MNLVPSRLSGLLVLPKPPPGICVDVRDGVPVETGLLPRRFCVFKGERVREREFKRVSHKGRPKFKIPIQLRNVWKSKKKIRPHACIFWIYLGLTCCSNTPSVSPACREEMRWREKGVKRWWWASKNSLVMGKRKGKERRDISSNLGWYALRVSLCVSFWCYNLWWWWWWWWF